MDEKTKRMTDKMHKLMQKGWSAPTTRFASEEEMDEELKKQEHGSPDIQKKVAELAYAAAQAKTAGWEDYAIPALGAAAGGLLGGPPGALALGAAGYGLTQLNKGPAAPKVEAPTPTSTTQGVGTGANVTSIGEAGGRFNALKNLTGMGSKAASDGATKLAWRALAGAGLGALGGALAGEAFDMDPEALALAGALGGAGLGAMNTPAAAAKVVAKELPAANVTRDSVQAALASRAEAASAMAGNPLGAAQLQAQRAPRAIKALDEMARAQKLKYPMTPELAALGRPTSPAPTAAAAPTAPAPVAQMTPRPTQPTATLPAGPAPEVNAEMLKKHLINPDGTPNAAMFNAWKGAAVAGSTKLALDMSHPVLGPALRRRMRAEAIS